ncbi:MAG: ABC transporter ATP-binding protein [Immundisolibacterales bacterium]|nr:ABC transporter ATP-binding protein [Immundisolibacterales bacterium]
MNDPLLKMRGVHVSLPLRDGAVAALNDVSLTVGPGEVLGLVGESGGGKSMLARAVAGLLPDGASLSGALDVDGRNIMESAEEDLTLHRGGGAAMCFQNPRSALSPTRRVGRQLVDRLVRWRGMAPDAAWPAARERLAEVGIREPERRLRAFPHELSGGMCQRVMIALALACKPRILLADEPTTGLDPTLTKDILGLFRDAAEREGCAVIIISHDVASIAAACDRIAVLYAGTLVEDGPARAVVDAPLHPYTRSLVAAVPHIDGRLSIPLAGSMPRLGAPPAACPFADRCVLVEERCRNELPDFAAMADGRAVRCFHAGEVGSSVATETAAHHGVAGGDGAPIVELVDVEVRYASQFGRRGPRTLRGVSMTLAPRETLGVVGESGCGKSTLARVIMGLVRPTAGKAVVGGVDYRKAGRGDIRRLRRDIQMVFQDPVDSLNPRMTVERNVRDPLRNAREPLADIDERIDRVLGQMGLGSEFRRLRPHRLSGGQAQRVALARALVVEPRVIVFDEPTSALDVTVQAQILDLLRDLMAHGTRSYVFVSHDLATVRGLCDRVAVLYLGRIVEQGPADEVLMRPRHPYTRALVDAVPTLSGRRTAAATRLKRDLDEAWEAAGCALEPRCPHAEAACGEPQTLRDLTPGHQVACWKAEHISAEALND